MDKIRKEILSYVTKCWWNITLCRFGGKFPWILLVYHDRRWSWVFILIIRLLYRGNDKIFRSYPIWNRTPAVQPRSLHSVPGTIYCCTLVSVLHDRVKHVPCVCGSCYGALSSFSIGWYCGRWTLQWKVFGWGHSWPNRSTVLQFGLKHWGKPRVTLVMIASVSYESRNDLLNSSLVRYSCINLLCIYFAVWRLHCYE
jgi:hypothetical protein